MGNGKSLNRLHRNIGREKQTLVIEKAGKRIILTMLKKRFWENTEKLIRKRTNTSRQRKYLKLLIFANVNSEMMPHMKYIG